MQRLKDQEEAQQAAAAKEGEDELWWREKQNIYIRFASQR
jgi:hypothetical protein